MGVHRRSAEAPRAEGIYSVATGQVWHRWPQKCAFMAEENTPARESFREGGQQLVSCASRTASYSVLLSSKPYRTLGRHQLMIFDNRAGGTRRQQRQTLREPPCYDNDCCRQRVFASSPRRAARLPHPLPGGDAFLPQPCPAA